MSATPPPRTRARATPARTHDRGELSDGSGGVLIAAAQILLGATFACLLAVLSVAALGVVMVLIIYLAR